VAVVDQAGVARVLAEEIRHNSELRRQLGMKEGTESGVVEDQGKTHLYITTDDGQAFAIGVTEVTTE
jgi:hypothetical protein